MTTHSTQSLSALLASLILVLPAAGQERREVSELRTYGEPSSADDRAAIHAFIEQYKSAWARQDTPAFIALRAADAEWINAYARLFQGAAPLAQFIEKRLFPAFDSSTSRKEIANMRRTHLHLVLEKQADQWRTVHTAIMDAR